jgi:GMP synthase-like glutamine amidotransferase
MRRAVVIGNESDADPALVGEALERHGYELQPLMREHHGRWPDRFDGDVVVPLGSDWSVYWDHVRDPVAAEMDRLRDAHERGVPILGICFGAQLLAHALGGHVSRSPVTEIGWVDVESAVPALADGPWFAWHYDRFTAPPGSELLASNDAAPQAFSLGSTVAVQFHPEVTGDVVLRWASGPGEAELAKVGVDRDALLADIDARVERARPAAHALVDWFLSRSAERPS